MLARARVLGAWLLTGSALAWVPAASVTAQTSAESSRAGHGSLSFSYQYQTADSIEITTGEVPIGPVDTHALLAEIEYHVTERLTLAAELPYVFRRYRGPAKSTHDPLLLDPPRPNVANVDGGDWNHDFQDIHLGVRYLLRSAPLTVEPYAFFGTPTNDYPFFGNAAIGQRQSRFALGSSFVYSPGLSDAYYGLDLSYEFVEKVMGVNVNNWRVNAEVGYFFTPRLLGRVFALVKQGAGLDFPDDFPSLTDERWYQHDRLVKHNYVNLGAGMSWALDARHRISLSWMTMVQAEIIHVMDDSYAFTLTRTF